jgi:Kef-type K+ transport system membrane component KefB
MPAPFVKTTLLPVAVFFAAGLAIGISLLRAWPFQAEYQLASIFVVFVILTLMRVGYRMPVRPLAFAFGAFLPYLVTLAWLGGTLRIVE